MKYIFRLRRSELGQNDNILQDLNHLIVTLRDCRNLFRLNRLNLLLVVVILFLLFFKFWNLKEVVVGSRWGLRILDIVMWHVVGSYWGCSECAIACDAVVCFFGCTIFLLGFLDQLF